MKGIEGTYRYPLKSLSIAKEKTSVLRVYGGEKRHHFYMDKTVV